jgi:protein-disulfide isomerase
MMRALLIAGLAMAATACARAPEAAPAVPVNIEDSAQVRAIVRDYLVNDPTLLKEALDALADRQHAERLAKMRSDPRDVAIGHDDAPITIVEFFDYRCPYCHAASEWVFALAQSRRDIRIVLKEFPVLGPASEEAARAALASRAQGRYREFHRALMAHTGALTPSAIDAVARSVGVDVARMRRDMNDAAITAHLEDNRAIGVDANVTGTPGFFFNDIALNGFHRDLANEKLAEATQAVRTAQR